MAADSLAFYDENLDTVSELREEISNTIRNEMVDDYASKELRQIITVLSGMGACVFQSKKNINYRYVHFFRQEISKLNH